MKDFKFKFVDLTFNFKDLPKYDQEYLRTMVFETIGERSVKNTGKPFTEMYPNPNNFTLFNNLKSFRFLIALGIFLLDTKVLISVPSLSKKIALLIFTTLFYLFAVEDEIQINAITMLGKFLK